MLVIVSNDIYLDSFSNTIQPILETRSTRHNSYLLYYLIHNNLSMLLSHHLYAILRPIRIKILKKLVSYLFQTIFILTRFNVSLQQDLCFKRYSYLETRSTRHNSVLTVLFDTLQFVNVVVLSPNIYNPPPYQN